MLKKIVLTITLYSLSSISQAMVVYDPANWAENVITAVQSQVTAVKSALIESHTLETMANTYATYQKVVDEYNLLNKNLEKLANLHNLIIDTRRSINTDNGHSALSQISALNPHHTHYENDRDKILSQYYEMPLDPQKIQFQFQGLISQDQIDAMKKQVEEQLQNYRLLQDTIDQSVLGMDKSKQRIADIKKMQDTLLNLGPTSALKTAQTSAAELNLLLQQNEQLIQQYNEVLKYMRMKKAEKESEKVKQSQAEQNTLKKSLNQGTGGLGRDRWGDL